MPIILTCWSPACGRTFPKAANGRPRRYCDDECRRAAQRLRDGLALARHREGERTAFLAATYGGAA